MRCEKCGNNFYNRSGICPLCDFIPSGVYQGEHRFELEPAGFCLRFFAYGIDTFFIFVVGFLLFQVFSFLRAIKGSPPSVLSTLCFVAFFLILLPPLMESSPLQGTPGKVLLGLRVTNEGYVRISFWTALFRNFCKVFSYLSGLIGFGVSGVTAHKQGFHDMMTGSLVVRDANTSPLRIKVGAFLGCILYLLFAYFLYQGMTYGFPNPLSDEEQYTVRKLLSFSVINIRTLWN